MNNDTRDRLVELIRTAGYDYDDFIEKSHERGMSVTEDFEEWCADHLIANGVIVPPCKVGDKVYYINTRPHIVLRQNEIYEAKVVRIVALSLGVSLVIHTRGKYGCCETPDIRDWNETVFLTKAQAEQKLKEMRVDNAET